MHFQRTTVVLILSGVDQGLPAPSILLAHPPCILLAICFVEPWLFIYGLNSELPVLCRVDYYLALERLRLCKSALVFLVLAGVLVAYMSQALFLVYLWPLPTTLGH